jgi:two-component system vancomycin resistance associated response regulator VraR
MKLKIALMDEYALALQGLYDNLKSVPDFEIVGAFTEIDKLLLCLQQSSADIVIVDLMLKDSHGLEVISRIREVQSEIKLIVLMISGEFEEVVYDKALEMGVKAFLQKNTSYNELINCIINVGKGNDVIPDFLVREGGKKRLSEMETKVLELIVKEYTNERIAKELYISKRTVENHVKNICRKLGAEGRVGIVREALRLKLI